MNLKITLPENWDPKNSEAFNKWITKINKHGNNSTINTDGLCGGRIIGN